MSRLRYLLPLFLTVSTIFGCKKDKPRIYCDEGEICGASVSPNPTDSAFVVTFSSNVIDSSSISVFSYQGERLAAKRVKILRGTNKCLLSIDDYPSGIYLVSIELDNLSDRLFMRVVKR